MDSFSILTYNIWFSQKLQIKRLKMLIAFIIKYDPDVVCLQEVIQPVLDVLVKYFKKKYPNVFPQNIINRSYGEVILSKHKFISSFSMPFSNTKMARQLSFVTLDLNTNKSILISTFHLESEFLDDNTTKKSQYKELIKTINEHSNLAPNNMFLAGDTNILEKENKDFVLNKWKDAWIENGKPKDKQYTYTSIKNTYIFKKYKSRFDRILYKSTDWKISDFKLIGTMDDCEIMPSDHFGLYTTFKKI